MVLGPCWAIRRRFLRGTAGPSSPTYALCSSAEMPKSPTCLPTCVRKSCIRPRKRSRRRPEENRNERAGIQSARERRPRAARRTDCRCDWRDSLRSRRVQITGQLFPVLSFLVSFHFGIVARLAGSADAAASYRGALGHNYPASARVRHTLALACVRAVPADFLWDEIFVWRVAYRAVIRRGHAVALSAELSDEKWICGSCVHLFCCVAAIGVSVQSVVARAGREPRRSRVAPPHQAHGWPGDNSVRVRDELRGHRLGDVAFASLGIHDLWVSVRCGTADLVNVVDDRGDCASGADGAVCTNCTAASFARPGQASPGLCDVVGVFRFLTAVDHLVRQFARGDYVLSHATARPMGHCRGNRGGFSLLRAVLFAVVARSEAQPENSSASRALADFYAFCRSFLDDAPRIHAGSLAEFVGFGGAFGISWLVALCFRGAVEANAAFAVGRSKTRGGDRAA